MRIKFTKIFLNFLHYWDDFDHMNCKVGGGRCSIYMLFCECWTCTEARGLAQLAQLAVPRVPRAEVRRGSVTWACGAAAGRRRAARSGAGRPRAWCRRTPRTTGSTWSCTAGTAESRPAAVRTPRAPLPSRPAHTRTRQYNVLSIPIFNDTSHFKCYCSSSFIIMILYFKDAKTYAHLSKNS